MSHIDRHTQPRHRICRIRDAVRGPLALTNGPARALYGSTWRVVRCRPGLLGDSQPATNERRPLQDACCLWSAIRICTHHFIRYFLLCWAHIIWFNPSRESIKKRHAYNFCASKPAIQTRFHYWLSPKRAERRVRIRCLRTRSRLFLEWRHSSSFKVGQSMTHPIRSKQVRHRTPLITTARTGDCPAVSIFPYQRQVLNSCSYPAAKCVLPDLFIWVLSAPENTRPSPENERTNICCQRIPLPLTVGVLAAAQ